MTEVYESHYMISNRYDVYFEVYCIFVSLLSLSMYNCFHDNNVLWTAFVWTQVVNKNLLLLLFKSRDVFVDVTDLHIRYHRRQNLPYKYTWIHLVCCRTWHHGDSCGFQGHIRYNLGRNRHQWGWYKLQHISQTENLPPLNSAAARPLTLYRLKVYMCSVGGGVRTSNDW